MSDHLAVLEEIAKEMRSIAPTCEPDWESELQDWASRLTAAIALMRGQSEAVGYVNAEHLAKFASGTDSATAVLYKRDSRWHGIRRVPVYAAPCNPAWCDSLPKEPAE